MRTYRDGRLQEQTQWRAKRFDMWTARLGELAPTAKVLAVVAQEIVVALAQPRARAPHDPESTRRIRRDADVKRPQPRELIERNLLDTARRIPTTASVDPMVSVSSPAHDKPSAGPEFSVHGLIRDDYVLDNESAL
jgi:hypothetical protein